MSVPPSQNRPEARPEVGEETLGRYALLDTIAAGEQCIVHSARALDGERGGEGVVAIKRLHAHHRHDAERQRALLREGQVASLICSPHVVGMFSVAEGDELFVVMDRIEGASLRALLAPSGYRDRSTTRFVVPIVHDALLGLAALHEGYGSSPNEPSAFVHQAPCPRHIMVGLDGRARLIDLSLAVGPKQPRSGLSDLRLQPSEMAPEQALAPAHIDPRCDIFIAGVTLWEALTGQRLFASSTAEEALARMLRGAIVPPSEAGAASASVFDQVCMRALARPRGHRYQSAAEMASDLRAEALRAGLFADPAEVSAWVAHTMARSAQASPVRRSAGRSTMQGIGVPTWFVPSQRPLAGPALPPQPPSLVPLRSSGPAGAPSAGSGGRRGPRSEAVTPLRRVDGPDRGVPTTSDGTGSSRRSARVPSTPSSGRGFWLALWHWKPSPWSWSALVVGAVGLVVLLVQTEPLPASPRAGGAAERSALGGAALEPEEPSRRVGPEPRSPEPAQPKHVVEPEQKGLEAASSTRLVRPEPAARESPTTTPHGVRASRVPAVKARAQRPHRKNPAAQRRHPQPAESAGETVERSVAPAGVITVDPVVTADPWAVPPTPEVPATPIAPQPSAQVPEGKPSGPPLPVNPY